MTAEKTLDGFRLFDFNPQTGEIIQIGSGSSTAESEDPVDPRVNYSTKTFREQLAAGEILTSGRRPIKEIASGIPPYESRR